MKIDPQVISKAVNISFSKFDHFRRARTRFLSQYVGRFYSRTMPGDREDKKAAPINLLHSGISTVVPNLVYNDPKLKIRSDIVAYSDYASKLELAINALVTKSNLKATLRMAIIDAIFLAGFIKTGLASTDEFITLDDRDIALGRPYAERVDPDDIILDPMARHWDEQSYIGNRFRATADDLIESGLYDEDEVSKLASRYDGSTSQDLGGAEGIIGDRTQQEFQSEVVRYVDLVEVYLPRENVVVTMPYKRDATQDKFLRVADYAGPAKGPYHMLGFAFVPNNVMPVAPAMIWYDLHILGNRIARKLSRQAERIKRVLAYQGVAKEDVEEIAEADDGETVRVEDIDKIREVQYGGAGTDSYNFMEWVKRQYSEQSGNLDLLSGQGANAPTATQSEMLQSNASVRVSDMQGLVYNFTQDVSADLVFHLHTDPFINLPMVRRVNGIDTQVHYSADQQQGDFLDYNIKVQPFSMGRQDPEKQARRKMEFATNIIPAAAQAVQILGPGFKIGAFLKRMADEIGIDDADEFINEPEFIAYIMQRLQMPTGDPGKAAGSVVMPQLPGLNSFNPGQPNPGQMAPSGGIPPSTEQAMGQQEAAGALQGGSRRQPSVSQLAQAHGS